MKTLNMHNTERKAIRETLMTDKHKSGVACDVCGAELYYLNPHMQLLSMPPQMTVSCENENCKDYNKIKYKIV